MSEKGWNVLSQIIIFKKQFIIDKVIIARDTSIKNDFYTDIQKLCKENNLSFCDRNDKYEIKTPYLIAISWRWLISYTQDQTLIVFHDSLLPKYRGFAPLVNALINGETTIGVTALLGTVKYDTGEILFQEKTNIAYPIKISEAITLVSKLYRSISLKLVKSIISERVLKTKVQNENLATYSLWRNEQDYNINWNKSAIEIQRFIHAVGYPYLNAVTNAGNKSYRIINATPINDVQIENRDNGKVIFVEDGYPVIVCGSGLLKITEMEYFTTGENPLPLKNFRTKFE